MAVRYANGRDLLIGEGARIHGGRWNPPGLFCAVYGSLDPQTSLAESLTTIAESDIPFDKILPLVLVAVEVELQRVLDLSDGRIRQHLAVSEERMLSEPWQKVQDTGHEALTQAIGRIAREEGLEGLIVPTARKRNGKNLLVFPDRLLPSSRLEIVNSELLPLPSERPVS